MPAETTQPRRTAPRSKTLASTAREQPSPPRFFSRTLGLGIAGSVLLFLALPPVGWWPLAWIAPVPWALLVRGNDLSGRRPYAALWVAGLAFWLPMLYWLCLAHPATSIGWIALCMYLACYLPLAVALARVAVHRFRVPLVLAMPVAWTGLELAQAHLLTGFDMAAVGHSQYRWLTLIQIADTFGAYGVTFLIVLVAAAIAAAIPWAGVKFSPWPLVAAATAMAATLAYGAWTLSDVETRPGPTITLVQGNIDTEIKFDPGEGQRVFDHYLDLTSRAYAERPRTDLIVWPETMFRYPLLTFSDDASVVDAVMPPIDELRARGKEVESGLGQLAQQYNTPLLLGVDTIHIGNGVEERYNSAQLIERDGRLGPRYDKSHPVMFGEYVPLARRWPWLYRFTPLGSGILAGRRSPGMTVASHVGDVRLSLNICYETVLAHVIRRQVRGLIEAGQEPDILMNLTNDGWFWGSHELDLHLMCGVFRAVECRKPLLAAANTGFSASIDSNGRILSQGPRHAPGWIIADVALDNRHSRYLRYGDVLSGTCLCCCIALAIARLKRR